jgi:hypothetical protein
VVHDAYRNALSAVRIPFEQTRDRTIQRGKQLTPAERRALPTKLRAELARFELELARPRATVAGIRSAESLLEQYDQTLGAALEWTAQRNEHRRRHARRRKVGALALVIAAPLSVWWGIAAAGRHSVNRERCAASAGCAQHGRCDPAPSAAMLFLDQAVPGYPSGAVWNSDLCTGLDCAELCARAGRCAPVYGSCRAVSDDDCARSEACRLHGECSLRSGYCVVGSHAECKQSERCREEGLCTVGLSTCEARLDSDCRDSEACRAEGRCRPSEGRCVHGEPEPDPCKAVCAQSGRCHVEAGQCVARYDVDCGFSDDCALWGLCEAEGGECIANHDVYCRQATVCSSLNRCVARGGKCVRSAPQQLEAGS